MPIRSGTILEERYRVKRILGEGAAATVWLAVDEALGRLVALKVLQPEVRRREAFWHEARAAASLNHPNIVTVHDVSMANGQVYLVLEYVEGYDLQTHLSRYAPLGVDEAARLFLQIARGVAAAHARGLIHRDLKPGNVLISAGGQAKVTDFGIAHVPGIGTELDGDFVRGTPAYIAPEQALGEPQTTASDVYSMGVMFFEMLTGRRPFDAVAPLEVVRAHINEPPPDITRHNVHVPPGMARFVERMLSKNPAGRPPDAGEVVEWLERYLNASETRTRAIPVMQPEQPPDSETPSHRRTVPAVAGSALLVLGILVILWSVTGVPALTDRALMAPALIERTATPTPTATHTTTPVPTATATATPTPTPQGAFRRNAPTLSAPVLSGASFTLDGRLNEWTWDGTPLIYVHFGNERWNGPQDLSGVGWLAWDKTALILAARVRDDAHVQTQIGRQLFRGDSVELWLDTDLIGDFEDERGNGDDWHLGFSPGDFRELRPEGTIYRPEDAEGSSHRIRVRAEPAAGGYTLEAVIPWDLLGVSPREGLALGYAIDLSDNDLPDTAEQQTQVASITDLRWNVPSTFGNLVLR